MANYTYNEYIYGVSSGNIITCKKTKQAVKRHLDDQNKEGFPFYFDEERAHNAIDFFRELVHTKGPMAGQKLEPEPWQQFIIAMLYGWRRKDNDFRRFRRAYIQIARKNGKTFLSSGVGLYDLLAEPGAEVYSAATKRDQAARCFSDARNTVRHSKTLRKHIQTYTHCLIFKDSKMTALSSDSKTQDGLNPSCAIIDEYHAHKTDALVNVIESGMSARNQPLLFIITTAGHDKNVPCYEEYERVSKILARHRGYENDTYFGLIYELDERDDWKNESNWIKANPNIQVSVDIDYLRIQKTKAVQKTSDEVEFRTKNLNMWMNAATAWISDAKWCKCQKKFSEENLTGLRCWGGIDLSKRLDITAFTWYFLLDSGKIYAKHYFFIPESQIEIKMRTDSYLIREWIKQGYVFATPGDSVDYDYMFKKIIDDAQKYNVQEIGYDRNLAEHLIEKLAENFTVVKMAQGITAISEPAKEWEKIIVDQKLIDNNPVMRWMVSCTQIKHDENDNIKPVKPDHEKSAKRIDGVITSIMAHNRLQIAVQEEQVQKSTDVDSMLY